MLFIPFLLLAHTAHLGKGGDIALSSLLHNLIKTTPKIVWLWMAGKALSDDIHTFLLMMI